MIFTKILKNTIQIRNVKYVVVFYDDDVIADMLSNKKFNSIVTDLFIGRKQNISLVFITQSYFAFPKNIRLNSTYDFIMKIPNKRELQQIAFNHSSDIDFNGFMYIYGKYTAKSYSF